MKATIDIPDPLYRKVKAKAANEGRRIREVTIELFQDWIGTTTAETASKAAPAGVPNLHPSELKKFKDMESLRKAFPKGYRLIGPLIPAHPGARILKAAEVSAEMENMDQEDLNSHVRPR